MKLWMKIAAVCTLALLVVVTACSAVLLVQAKDSLLALTMEQVKDGQRSLQNSFSSMADYYIDADAGAAAEYSMAIYCFSQFADETGVLLCGAENNGFPDRCPARGSAAAGRGAASGGPEWYIRVSGKAVLS